MQGFIKLECNLSMYRTGKFVIEWNCIACVRSELAREWSEKIRDGVNFSVYGATFIEVERILEEFKVSIESGHT